MSNVTQLNIGKDVSNSACYSPPFSNHIYNIKLPKNNAQSVFAPEGADTVVFSYGAGGDVFVAFDGIAVIPSSAFQLLKQELNPQARDISSVPINGGFKVFSLICEEDNYVTLAFYTRNGFSSI